MGSTMNYRRVSKIITELTKILVEYGDLPMAVVLRGNAGSSTLVSIDTLIVADFNNEKLCLMEHLNNHVGGNELPLNK